MGLKRNIDAARSRSALGGDPMKCVREHWRDGERQTGGTGGELVVYMLSRHFYRLYNNL